MTTEPDEKENTAPLELPQPPASAVSSPYDAAADSSDAASDTQRGGLTDTAIRPALVARPANGAQQDVLFVPLAVSIGDGFKFGCGFFLAAVLALLVGFVLLAVLFVLTSLFGLNLPISR